MSGWYGRLLGVVGITFAMAGTVSAAAQTPPAAAAAPPANASFEPAPAAAPAASAAPAAEGGAAPAPAPVATPVPPASAACYPSCRSGYLCHEGECISRCNPVCRRGERCLPDGECETIKDEDEDAASSQGPNVILKDRGSWVFAARVGLELTGSGHVSKTCSATGIFECTASTRSEDLDDKSWFMLGLDAMVHVSRGLRLGVGYQLLPRSADGPPNYSGAFRVGNEHQLAAIVEGLIPIASNMAFALRAQGGPRMLVVGGSLADSNDGFLRDCYAQDAKHCEVDQGPLFGGGIGAMVGFLGGDKLRWRTDLAVEHDILAWPSQKEEVANVNTGTLTTDATFSMTRLWILGGIEL